LKEPAAALVLCKIKAGVDKLIEKVMRMNERLGIVEDCVRKEDIFVSNLVQIERAVRII
jgi:hypothetical protein